MGAVQLLNDEGVEVVAALLAVADDVDAGVLLVLEALKDCFVGDLIELGEGDAPRLALAQCSPTAMEGGPSFLLR